MERRTRRTSRRKKMAELEVRVTRARRKARGSILKRTDKTRERPLTGRRKRKMTNKREARRRNEDY